MKCSSSMFDHPVFRRSAFIFVVFFIGEQTAFAQSCLLDGRRYELIEETVDWSMTITRGRSCIQGIRFANVEIKSLKLISQPKFGQVALRGSGFIYSANENAVGKDSFILAVTGIIGKHHGGSTIRVSVSIAEPSEPAPPGSVDRPSAPPEMPQVQPQPAINTMFHHRKAQRARLSRMELVKWIAASYAAAV